MSWGGGGGGGDRRSKGKRLMGDNKKKKKKLDHTSTYSNTHKIADLENTVYSSNDVHRIFMRRTSKFLFLLFYINLESEHVCRKIHFP